MMYWDKRLPSGFSDLGPIEIAPVAQAFVLTDRADGSLWLVSLNTTFPTRLSIVDDFGTMQRREGVKIYEAADGPVFGINGQYRLMLRGGRIGVEFTPFATGIQDRDDPPLYARSRFHQGALDLDTIDVRTLHIELDA